MKKLLIFALCTAGVLFTACETPETGTAAPGSGIADTQPIGQISPPTVYVAGYEYETPGTSTAKYWVNGVETELPVPDLPSYTFSGAKALSIFVSGTDIYVAGQISYMNASSVVFDSAAYWKDDGISIETVILDEAWTSGLESKAYDIFVSGGNVYVVGYKQTETTYTEYATLWTNNTETTLDSDGHPTMPRRFL